MWSLGKVSLVCQARSVTSCCSNPLFFHFLTSFPRLTPSSVSRFFFLLFFLFLFCLLFHFRSVPLSFILLLLSLSPPCRPHVLFIHSFIFLSILKGLNFICLYPPPPPPPFSLSLLFSVLFSFSFILCVVLSPPLSLSLLDSLLQFFLLIFFHYMHHQIILEIVIILSWKSRWLEQGKWVYETRCLVFFKWYIPTTQNMLFMTRNVDVVGLYDLHYNQLGRGDGGVRIANFIYHIGLHIYFKVVTI